MRSLSASLTLAGFTVVTALFGCSSDAGSPTPVNAVGSTSSTSGVVAGAPPVAVGSQAGSSIGSGSTASSPVSAVGTTSGSATGGVPGTVSSPVVASGGVLGNGGSPVVASGGVLGNGGSRSATGGVLGNGGSPSATGGVLGNGGSPIATGGVPGTGGSRSVTGGAPGTGGLTAATGGSSTAVTGPDVDQLGKANAAPGATTSAKQDYLRMGEIRLINNNWGAAKLGCTSPMNVFINQDKSFGWNFDRGDCDKAGSNSSPDFPQLEFGIHPFGIGSADATSPGFSSTTLLPLQIKDITSASVTLDGLTITLDGTNNKSWDLTFEFWISQQNPATTQGNAGVYAELMTFWGWQDGRYPEPPNGTGPKGTGAGDLVTAGTKTYKLEVQDDAWAGGKWRYFQFRTTDGPLRSFTGTVDVKPLIDYLVTKRGYSKDFWVARLEVGSEIDDMTKGTVTMKNVIFEVNGQKRSPVFGK